jgi:DNA-binding GntR family transcriptional regulator
MEIKTVSNTVVEYLRSQIVTGKLGANQKLNENYLATSLGISRPPIREAFRMLEGEHLVITIPRKGTYVSDLSIEDLKGLCEVREMIECYTIDLFKTKGIKDLPKVESALEEALRLSLPSVENLNEMLHYHKVFADFHIKLVESAGNYRLLQFYKAISSNLTRYQIIYLFIPGAAPHSVKEHHQVLDLIKMGSYKKAKEVMRQHINYAFELLQEKFVPKITV